MRVLDEKEVQQVSAGITPAEMVFKLGGLLVGENSPTVVKNIVGTLALPFALLLGYVIGANTG